jgi:hypothetical protein
MSLLLILFYFVFTEIRSVEISAEELANIYSRNIRSANEKYLNKEIEMTGKVKVFFELEEEDDLLELISDDSEIRIFCILQNDEQINKAKLLTRGTEIKIKGRCLGLAENKFPNSVYIQATEMK